MEMSMFEAQDGALAPVENVPGTQPDSNQPATSEPANPPTTGTEGSEQDKTEQQTPEQKASRFQRRLDRQKAARVAAETEARLLRERVAELEGRKQQTPESQGADPNDPEPQREKFDDYEAYSRALARWEGRQEARKTVAEERKRNESERTKQRDTEEQSRLVESWNESQDKAREELDDFDEVVGDSEAPTTPTMTRAIMESPVGGKVLYHLAQHPDEAERIAKLSPVRQIAEIGKLEDKISQAKPPPRKPSSAPEPITPNKGSAPTAKSIYDKDISDDEFSKKFREARRRR